MCNFFRNSVHFESNFRTRFTILYSQIVLNLIFIVLGLLKYNFFGSIIKIKLQNYTYYIYVYIHKEMNKSI
jgi:hypothetical protein